MKVLAFGEIVWDIIGGNKHLGGAPFNFAAHLAKYGAQVSLVSAVGSDIPGAQAIVDMKDLQVDSQFVAVLNDIPTSTVDVFLDRGEPHYIIHEGVSFDFIPMPAGESISGSPDLFYFGTLAQRSEESLKTLRGLIEQVKAKEIFCDLNLRQHYFNKEVIEYSLSKCTILKLNEKESKTISSLLFGSILGKQELADALASSYNIGIIITTASEKGCYIFRKGQFTHVPARPVSIADAVGAGDAFSAAFMHSYFHSGNELRAASAANEVGAFVASQKGAVPRYPKELLEGLLNSARGVL